MCEWCHHECCCQHGNPALRFWGLGGATHPRAWWGPEFRSEPPPSMRREYLEEQKAALTQRLRWLDAQLKTLEG